MLISSSFQGFYFSLLTDIYKQMLAGKRVCMTFEKFRDNIKKIDVNYPYYDNTADKVSLKDIRSGDLVKHIDFIIKWCGEYGITPLYIEDDWNRIMQSAHE